MRLAGLAGHGQTDMLLSLLGPGGGRFGRSCQRAHGPGRGDGRRTHLSLWSIARNISAGSLRDRSRAFLIDARAELAEEPRERIRIRTPDIGNDILSLSGGNQQKALFARACGFRADGRHGQPDAHVDVGTSTCPASGALFLFLVVTGCC